ncbi:MAG: type II secretion system protein GspK [Capsulimonadales bacterium]|nr:type II secretion system protein GspK [Capsulimonadales bacterium]
MRTTARRFERGGVLVQALIVLAGLVTLIASLAASQRATLQSTQAELRSRRAELAARAAVQRALAVLPSTAPSAVTQADDWFLLGGNGNRAYDLGDSSFRLQIVDGGSLVNLNTADLAQLQLLPLTQEQIDSLLDWRETGQQARPNGAKDAYYNALPQPYNTKLGALSTTGELLLIRGWTARALYGQQTDIVSTAINLQDAGGNPLPLIAVLTPENGAPNQQTDGSPRINLNQGNLSVATFARFGITGQAAAQLAARGPYASFRNLLTQPGINLNNARSLLDAAGFSGATRVTGRINLNTAPQSVLETVPGITPEIAASIVAQQTNGFQSLGDLTTVGGMNLNLLGQIADAVTIGSDTFLVRAYGESGGVGVAIEATVGIRNNRAQILRWERLADPGIPSWWNWNETVDQTVDAGTQT